MDHFQGITVEVISNGQALDFYEDPDAAEPEEICARHHYIEAVAGSTFQVKATLTPEFKFYTMKAEDAVQILVNIDGCSSLQVLRTKKYLQGKFSTGKTVEEPFIGPRHFCMQTKQWMLRDYSFGNLILKEAQDPGTFVKEAQKLGRILVTVKRVKLEKGPAWGQNKTPIATINEMPEKALKGRPIETIIGFANARPASEPPIQYEYPTSIGGEAGKPTVFNIYYRSRRALQMLGCIPRSPSPEVQKPEDEAIAPGDAVQEVRDLRARLAILERNLEVKAEPTSTHRNLKRERDEERNMGSVQRRRLAAQVEHIDLTGD